MRSSLAAGRRLLLLLLAVALGVGVFPALSAPTAQAAYPAPYKVLMMGDSWASGEGLGEYVGPTACHRSARAWSSRVLLPNSSMTVSYAATQGWAAYVSTACSGAGLGAILGGYSNPDLGIPYQAPQINSVNTSYTHVFISIGGNDTQFPQLLSKCAIGGKACTDQIATSRAAIQTHRTHLTQVLRRIHDQSRAQVVLAGYGPLLDPAHDKPFLNLQSYAPQLNQLAWELELMQREVTTSLRREGLSVSFASNWNVFNGHGPDAPAPRLYPLTLVSYVPPKAAQNSLHPNWMGHNDMAATAQRVMQGRLFIGCPTVMVKGDAGSCVRELQRLLQRQGYTSIVTDGIFGTATANAVYAFQTRRGLTQDYKVGPNTKAALYNGLNVNG